MGSMKFSRVNVVTFGDPHSEPRGGDIEWIKRDIKRARRWARKHFPSEGGDTLLDSPKFNIQFFEDRMKVVPRFMGKDLGIWVPYRLMWLGDELYWECEINKNIRLKVPEEEIIDG